MMPAGEFGGFGSTVKAFAVMSDAVRDQVAEGVRYITWYPPQRNSNYRRTGTLRNSWDGTTTTGNRRIEGIIGSSANIAPYNQDVQGANQEALFKELGWRNVEDLQNEVEKDFPKRVQRAIDKAY